MEILIRPLFKIMSIYCLSFNIICDVLANKDSIFQCNFRLLFKFKTFPPTIKMHKWLIRWQYNLLALIAKICKLFQTSLDKVEKEYEGEEQEFENM